jgi:DNA mismatch repair protein MutS2
MSAPASTVSPATLAALELPALLRLIAALAVSDLGAEEVLALAPVLDPEELELRRRRFEEARVLLVDGALIAGLDEPLRPLLSRLADGRAVLDGGDVLQAAALLRAALRAAQRVAESGERPCPRLAELFVDLPDGRPWLRRVDAILDARGVVRDDASPELVRLRSRIQGLRDTLYRDLEASVARYGEHLSEETIPLHEGRLVLLLKSGAKGQLDGLVHGRSGSGRSFYFEPLQAVEGNNRLRAALDDETAERARLLAELLAGLRELSPALARGAGIVAELDRLQATARFAELAEGRLAELGSADELRLCAARHPLLDPGLAELRQRALGHAGHTGEMVPLDLELDAGCRLLVVTGPNAGGKTVALKTAGLFTLATLCGLPVPCAPGTRVPRVERLVATVGDEQDLLHDHSTFSARLLRLWEAWEAAGPGALVLLDELGSGTDPDEGAALATALLEHLRLAGGLTLVTTHLTRLAALALEAEGAACAAMEFDGTAGRPTYRLLPGTPGASEALALAAHLGLPAAWLERATAELDPEQRSLQRLLSEVETTRQELARERDRALREGQRLEAAREESEREREALAQERAKVARRLKAELDGFERRVRERLRAAEEAMREEFKRGRRRGVAAAAAAELLADPPVELAQAEVAASSPAPIEVGGLVRHQGLGWEGRLERLARGQAEVNVRGMTMRCPVADLQGVSAAAVAAPKTAVAKPPAPVVAAELQLIGRRVDEALVELDSYLDRALLGGSEEVRVVHGHGSGRLRSAVRAHLDSHRAVAGHRPGGEGEGGDGATVVTLRG